MGGDRQARRVGEMGVSVDNLTTAGKSPRVRGRERLLHLLRQRGIVEVNGVPVEEFVRVQEVL